jgi:RNA polymerase sigma-70 factor (ECF subfamily)
MHLRDKTNPVNQNMIEELIHRIKQKERKAQEEFYKKYSTQMFRLIYRYVKSESDTEDILNMGFFKIFSKIDTVIYINEICFMGWMKKIMINESLMFLRGRISFIEIDKCSEGILVVDGTCTENNLMMEDYYNLINQLPHDLRTVFNLYAIDGFTHKEIAAELNISESSSRVYLMRARLQLRRSLTRNKIGI